GDVLLGAGRAAQARHDLGLGWSAGVGDLLPADGPAAHPTGGGGRGRGRAPRPRRGGGHPSGRAGSPSPGGGAMSALRIGTGHAANGEAGAAAGFERYRFAERIGHWVVALTFIALMLSGFALGYPRAYFLSGLFGGGQTMRFL